MAVFAGPQNIPTQNLFLHLDATNPRSYSGTGSTWYDISGNNNHGTIVNSPVHNGKSFVFTKESLQRISVPYNSKWRMIGSNSISFWASNANDPNQIAVAYQKGGWEGYLISALSVDYSGTAGSNDFSSSITKSANEWALLTFVINRSLGNYYLYKNNTLVFSKSIVHPDLSSLFSNGELTIGGQSTTVSRFYSGSISNVMFYDKALSQSEINQIFESTRNRYGI
jgi:hypothetical protein